MASHEHGTLTCNNCQSTEGVRDGLCADCGGTSLASIGYQCGLSLRECLDAALAEQREFASAMHPRPRYKRIGTLLVPVLPRGDDS